MHDIEQLLELAQDVVDRCMPIVPSSPLVRLADAATDFIEADHDSVQMAELADAIEDVTRAWCFWPPEEFGSSRAEGPSAAALDQLREAINAVRSMEPAA